jgi:hypothetical protein
MRYFLIYILQLVFVTGAAQPGHFFLSNHSPGDKTIDHVAFDIMQDHNGVLHFATRSGIVSYDGKNWDLISCGAVYALELTDTGEIFWTGAQGFGKIRRSPGGRLASELVSDAAITEFYHVAAVGSEVYFMNEETIFIYDEPSVRTITAGKYNSGSFTTMLKILNRVFVQTSAGQLFWVDGNQLKKAGFDFGHEIVFACGLDDQYLLVTSNNKLFLQGINSPAKEIKIKERDYLDASVIVNGAWVNDQLIALGTLRGGVIFMNPLSGEIEEIVNYNTGLPDNEILSLFVDGSKNVWVSHEYGFTRIAPFVPFRSYSSYDNLRGNPLCVTSVNDEVYVGTSLGLFKLIRKETYDEIVYYEEVPVTTSAQLDEKDNKDQISSVTQNGTIGKQKKKNGFLGFLRRNRNKVEESSHDVSPAKNGLPGDGKSNQNQGIVPQKSRKTQKILRSTNFVYEKVSGIEAKVTTVTLVNDQVLAAGIGGLFQVQNLSAKRLIDQPVRSVFVISDSLLAISNYNEQVHLLIKEGTEWRPTRTSLNIDDQISFAFAGSNSESWLCGIENVYRLEKDKGGFIVTSFSLDNPDFSATVGLCVNRKPLFVNSNGFFGFREHGVLEKIDSLASPINYFITMNSIWFRDKHDWNIIGEAASRRNIQLLNLCSDVRFLAMDRKSSDVWVINGDRELYKFLDTPNLLSANPYSLFLKSVEQNGMPLKGTKRMAVHQENGPIGIHVAQANFTGGLLEYRYLLKGLEDKWSEWSGRNDHINFPYLPPGHYSLEVQSRDMFGTIREAETLQLHVQPPYWKTSWFYAMEFTIFSLLVLLSFKLSVRYRFVSRMLSLLTIILLIEFIQTIVGVSFFTNSSPIIDFLIQVFVALVILPIEGFLRNFMFKSMGSNSRLFQIITELDRQQRNKKI